VGDVDIPDLKNRSIALQCLNKALAEAHRLKAFGLFTSVNVEAWMLNDLDQLIREPDGIMVELTEREEMDRPEVFTALQAKGYQFMIDDWPDGFSRNHLKALAHGGMVKISHEYFRSSKQDDLIRDIEDMRVHGMQVVVEGVETDEHWNKAIAVGAEFVQGFHPRLGLPIPLKEFEQRFLK